MFVKGSRLMLSSGRFLNLSCCCSGCRNTVLSYLAPNHTHGMKPLPRHQDSRTLLQRPQRQVKRTNDTAAYPDAYLALLRDCHELADVVLLGRLLQVPALVGTTSLGEPSATPTVESSRSGGPGGAGVGAWENGYVVPCTWACANLIGGMPLHCQAPVV